MPKRLLMLGAMMVPLLAAQDVAAFEVRGKTLITDVSARVTWCDTKGSCMPELTIPLTTHIYFGKDGNVYDFTQAGSGVTAKIGQVFPTTMMMATPSGAGNATTFKAKYGVARNGVYTEAWFPNGLYMRTVYVFKGNKCSVAMTGKGRGESAGYSLKAAVSPKRCELVDGRLELGQR
jgi:hypothetical protein